MEKDLLNQSKDVECKGKKCSNTKYLNSYGKCSECAKIWTPEKFDNLDKKLGLFKKKRFQGPRKKKTTTKIKYGKGKYKTVSTLIKIGDDEYTPMVAYIPKEDKLNQIRSWKKRNPNPKWRKLYKIEKEIGKKKFNEIL